MKIGILTHYTVINQGAVLQMYALQNWLIELGHKVIFLTYTKNFDFRPQETAKYNLSIKYFPFYFKEYVLKKGIRLSWFNVKKQLLYRKYIRETFTFKNYATEFMDMVIVGSDEVFSLENGCNMMMYGHGVNTNCLISYAPSFGQTGIDTINQFHCKELILSGLMKFLHLSVRDARSAQTIEALTGITPQIVCDPVLLYKFDTTYAPVKPLRKKYLFVYSYDRHMTTPDEYSGILQYAKSKGLMTVSAGTYHKWCDKNIVCNPIEWLEYFREAEEVITDTFHGAVLSIVTNKPSVYYVRALNENKLTDLLTAMELGGRISKSLSFDEISLLFSRKTDFSVVNEKWSALRKQSEEYLLKCLGG